MDIKPLPKLNWSLLLPACSAGAVVWTLVSYARFPLITLPIVTLLSVVILLGGLTFLYLRRRLGYIMVGVGAAFALSWIFMTESRAIGNSWIALNAWNDPNILYIRYSEVRIISVTLLVATFLWAATRLLPSHWQFRNIPLCQRTWPAVVTALIVVVYWFATSAVPYRQPIIVDGADPELSILHVQKDGTIFHETRVSLYHNGRYYVVQNNRHLFRYRFDEVAYEGVLTDDLRTQLIVLKALPSLSGVLNAAPKPLRAQHGKGWYTATGHKSIAAFTTENGTGPPAELVAFFREVAGLPLSGTGRQYEVRDVCLGFCYDPKAGLGYRAENERCVERSDGKEYCY